MVTTHKALFVWDKSPPVTKNPTPAGCWPPSVSNNKSALVQIMALYLNNDNNLNKAIINDDLRVKSALIEIYFNGDLFYWPIYVSLGLNDFNVIITRSYVILVGPIYMTFQKLLWMNSVLYSFRVGLTDKKSASIQIMAWHQTGNKPLSVVAYSIEAYMCHSASMSYLFIPRFHRICFT